jgi:hypothetical protein
MTLFELAMEDLPLGHYNPQADKHQHRSLGDTRKPQLSLRKLNRLKKLRALRQLENLKHEDLLQAMYGEPAADAAGGAGGGLGGGMGF